MPTVRLPNTVLRLVPMCVLPLIAACAMKQPAALPPVVAPEMRFEPDTLAVTGMSADDFPPATEDSTAAGDSTLVESPEMADSSSASPEALFHQANERYKRAQNLIGDARAQVDTALALLDSIPNDEETSVLADRDEMVMEVSRLLRQLGVLERDGRPSRNGELPLQMNRFVEREIRRFQTTERARFIRAYRRSGMYVPAIKKRLREAGMPEQLAWLALIESEYNCRALSRARALGPWQFIASTGYRYGLRRDRWVDQRMDFKRSTTAAIAYLRDLHDLFGDWNTALAAYNSGEGRVMRLVNRQPNGFMDDFWDLYVQLPSETARYVPRFHAVLNILHDPAKFGFTDLPKPIEPLRFDTVVVKKQMKLSDIAARIGVGVGQLKLLNPHLRSWITPNYSFTLRVPRGKGEQTARLVPSIPETRAPELPLYVVHRVRSGETLGAIARRYHTTVRAIQRANRIRNPRYVRAGRRLRVPTRYAGRTARRRRAAPIVRPDGAKVHVVQRGDTLWDISRQYKTSITQLRRLNGLRRYENIYPGQKLIVSVAR